MTTPTKPPASAAWLTFFGVLSLIAGALCFAAGVHDKSDSQFALALSGFVGGLVLVGFAAALRLLARIADSTEKKDQ